VLKSSVPSGFPMCDGPVAWTSHRSQRKLTAHPAGWWWSAGRWEYRRLVLQVGARELPPRASRRQRRTSRGWRGVRAACRAVRIAADSPLALTTAGWQVSETTVDGPDRGKLGWKRGRAHAQGHQPGAGGRQDARIAPDWCKSYSPAKKINKKWYGRRHRSHGRGQGCTWPLVRTWSRRPARGLFSLGEAFMTRSGIRGAAMAGWRWVRQARAGSDHATSGSEYHRGPFAACGRIGRRQFMGGPGSATGQTR